MGCKRNKWACEEGGGGGCFPEREVLVLCLDGEPIGRGDSKFGIFSYVENLIFSLISKLKRRSVRRVNSMCPKLKPAHTTTYTYTHTHTHDA